MEPNNGPLKSISKVISQLSKEFHIEEKKEYHEALRDWKELVGPRLADHTKPLYIENRVLHVGVEGSAWAQEVSFRKNAIIQGVNNRLGRPHVTEIRCKTLEKK